jgi:hypothetical protein
MNGLYLINVTVHFQISTGFVAGSDYPREEKGKNRGFRWHGRGRKVGEFKDF